MKLVEEFTKIEDEFTVTSLKNQEGIQQENSALSLRVALLGKTEEEQKKINESYKVQGDISKINAKYDKERLELQQKYLKLQADGFDVDYDVWNKQIQQSVQQQGEEAKLVWAGVAMSAAESMQKEFDAIKSSITDVITTALFDGGKAGSKKLRDQIVQAFRNKITVVIDAVVNTAVDLSVALKKQNEALALVKQATSDYNLALAEAQGNTQESARLQRELSNATKLATGWTQVQIDTLNSVIDAAKALVSLKENLSVLDSARLAVVSAFRSIEDAAKNTQAAVDSAKEAITQGYVNALDQQTQAQSVINDLIRQSAVEMAGFASTIKEFLLQMATTDLGANSKAEQLKALQDDFLVTAGLAKAGSTKAYGSITGKAQSLLTAGKEQFSTQAEFARFSSSIGNTLLELATLADGKAGPLAEAVDPMIEAQAQLVKTNAEVLKWTKALNESGASTALTVKDYADDWRNAQAANTVAQADLLAAQLATKDINMQLVTVLGSLANLISTFNTASAKVPVYGGTAPVTPVGTSYTGMGGDIKTIQDLYSVNLGRQGDAAGMEFWANAFLGDGVIDAAERQQFAMAAIPEYLSSLNSFAVGTNYVPSDMTATIHKGERIIPEADNTELMQRLSSPYNQDNSELVLEIQRLNSRLATIESNTASTAGHAAKTARLLDRAMPDGDALATRTAEAI